MSAEALAALLGRIQTLEHERQWCETEDVSEVEPRLEAAVFDLMALLCPPAQEEDAPLPLVPGLLAQPQPVQNSAEWDRLKAARMTLAARLKQAQGYMVITQEEAELCANGLLRSLRAPSRVATQPVPEEALRAENAQLRTALKRVVTRFDKNRQWHTSRGGESYPDTVEVLVARAALQPE